MQINYFRWIKAEHLKKSTSFPGILNAFNITSLWKEEEKNHQILEYFEKKKKKEGDRCSRSRKFFRRSRKKVLYWRMLEDTTKKW